MASTINGGIAGRGTAQGDDGFALARRIAGWHHEDWDGMSYPDGLRGEAFPFAARIVRIVDVFDALRSERPYKPAWSLGRTLEELRVMKGHGLDPVLTDLFLGSTRHGRCRGPTRMRDASHSRETILHARVRA
ncbi:MAG: HD domain-containing phosphohydrolase [Candidatus Limnocylindrales bacterium]